MEITAEPNRRRPLHLLARGEQAVGELAAQFIVSHWAVSQHLLLLVSRSATGGVVVCQNGIVCSRTCCMKTPVPGSRQTAPT
ncbi:ArsR family transcriptional regulator [Arthrobacter sp. OY3WO11]|uniref:ArsR family transcriptional regulator n=1 Tax=Arthrobacter sp. OY3WO11 TaxID=1835723 RepID=UPI002570C7FA|nr:ArsR family transcriptional regulator [Arthrobacter sp. OY3WO11]